MGDLMEELLMAVTPARELAEQRKELRLLTQKERLMSKSTKLAKKSAKTLLDFHATKEALDLLKAVEL